MSKDTKKFTEFYYYDGSKFQRCLITGELSNSMLDENIPELISYTTREGFNRFVTEAKVEKKCLYKVENVPNLIYVNTYRGWELLMTDSMDVKVKGLDTIDIVDINVRPVLLVPITDSYDIGVLPHLELSTSDIFNPIVKEVPKVVDTDKFDMPRIELEGIETNTNTSISFLDIIDCVLTDRFTMSNNGIGEILTSSEVTITLS